MTEPRESEAESPPEFPPPTDAQIAELKAGGQEIHAIDLNEMGLTFLARTVSRVQAARFKAETRDGDRDGAVKHLLFSVIAYPDGPTLTRLFDRYGFLDTTLCDYITSFSGAANKVTVRKI